MLLLLDCRGQVQVAKNGDLGAPVAVLSSSDGGGHGLARDGGSGSTGIVPRGCGVPLARGRSRRDGHGGQRARRGIIETRGEIAEGKVNDKTYMLHEYTRIVKVWEDKNENGKAPKRRALW